MSRSPLLARARVQVRPATPLDAAKLAALTNTTEADALTELAQRGVTLLAVTLSGALRGTPPTKSAAEMQP